MRICQILILFCCLTLVAEDWPCLRPHGDGFSGEKNLLKRWPDKGLRQVWRKTIGPGFSGISVVDDQIYTMMGDKTYEYCISLDAKTSKFLWLKRIGYLNSDNIGAGPRSTPTVDGNYVYVINTHGELWCLDKETGAKKWHHNLLKKYELRKLGWGVCGSPIVYKDLVIQHIGSEYGQIIALQKETGKEAWREDASCSYSTPTLTKVHGNDQAIFFTDNSVMGLDPNDGTKRWEYPWGNRINAATPIYHNNHVFISASYGAGAAVVEVLESNGSYDVKEVWKNPKMQNHYSTSLLWKDHIIGFHKGILKCIEFQTARKKWTQRGFGKGFLLGVEDNMIILSQQGVLTLAKLSTKDYEEISVSYPFATTTCYTAPSLSNGRLFIRDTQNEIVCLDLTQE